MRRLALPLLVLATLVAAPLALADDAAPTARATAVPVPCATATVTAADLLPLDRRQLRGGLQLACSPGCLRRCAAVYRACQARSRDWRRCSAVRRNCIRSCGC